MRHHEKTETDSVEEPYGVRKTAEDFTNPLDGSKFVESGPIDPLKRDFFNRPKSTETLGLVSNKTLDELKIILADIEWRQGEMTNQLTVMANQLLNQKTKQVYSITINDLAEDEWELNSPLIVAVEQDSEEDFIACFYDADVYGHGDSIKKALDDLKVGLVNQLEFLLEKEKQANLEADTRKQLKVLRRHIKKCQQESNPWLEFAGIFENEPLFDDVLKEIEAHRKELDEDFANE